MAGWRASPSDTTQTPLTVIPNPKPNVNGMTHVDTSGHRGRRGNSGSSANEATCTHMCERPGVLVLGEHTTGWEFDVPRRPTLVSLFAFCFDFS
jgi:hypothetical protein